MGAIGLARQVPIAPKGAPTTAPFAPKGAPTTAPFAPKGAPTVAAAPRHIFAVVICAEPQVVRQRVFTIVNPTSATIASAAKIKNPV